MKLRLYLGLVISLFSMVGHAMVTDWQSFQIRDGHIMVPSKVEGIEGFALIDSASKLNMLNQQFIAAHDLKLEFGAAIKFAAIDRKSSVNGVNVTQKRLHGSERIPLANNVNISIFDNDYKLNHLAAHDIGAPEIQLVLGTPFWEQFIVQIDYPNRQLRFATRDSLNLKKLQNVNSQANFNSGLPMVEVELDGQEPAWLVLDTSETGALYLERKMASANGWLDEYPTVQQKSNDLVKSANVDTFNLPTIKIGPYQLENVLVAVPTDNSGLKLAKAPEASTGTRISRTKKVDGVLGFDVLQHFVLTLDTKNGLAHFGLPK